MQNEHILFKNAQKTKYFYKKQFDYQISFTL